MPIPVTPVLIGIAAGYALRIMRLSPLVSLMLGLGAGLVVGFLLAPLLHDSPANAPKEHRTESSSARASSNDVALRVVDRPGEDPKDPVAKPVALSEKGRAALQEFEHADWSSSELEKTWSALATLYAVSGDMEGFHRMVDVGVEVGASAYEIVSAVEDLPTKKQVQALNVILGRHPDVALLGEEIAEFYVEHEKAEAAAAWARYALTRDVPADLKLMRILINCDPVEAASLLPSLAQAQEAWDGGCYATVSRMLYSADHATAALTILRLGLAQAPEHTGLLQLAAKHEPSTALKIALSRTTKNPLDAVAWSIVGSCRTALGDKTGAFQAYLVAAQTKPTENAMEALLKCNPEKAVPIITEMLASSDNDEEIGILGDGLLQTERMTEAVEVYVRAHLRDPDDSEWLALIVRMDPQQAVELVGPQVIPLESATDDELMGIYAKALIAEQRPGEAFDYLARAHQRDKTDSEWLYELAKLDPARAGPLIEAARKDFEDKATAAASLAIVNAAQGDRERAKSFALEAIKHEPDTEWTWYAAARVDSAWALKQAKQRIASNPTGVLWAGVAYTHVLRGEWSAARSAYDEAIKLSPDSRYWRIERQKLEGR